MKQQREEEVLVLYGSQTGNSEQAAVELRDQMKSKLEPLLIGSNLLAVTPKLMQLDDFLEMEQAKWTRLVVIIVSSYGIGQAPLGARRFREFIDYLIATYSTNHDNNHATSVASADSSSKSAVTSLNSSSNNESESAKSIPPPLLSGISFALCGLGDSKFSTFFQNPTAIWRGLQLAGAVHVGPLGKADASSGRDLEIITEWRDAIWPHLAKVLNATTTTTTTTTENNDTTTMKERLHQMQQDTLEICYRLNPDMQQKRSKQQTLSAVNLSTASSSLPIWTLAVAAILLLASIFFTSPFTTGR